MREGKMDMRFAIFEGMTNEIDGVKKNSVYQVDKVEDLPIRLTAEDFSYYSQEIPVCFFRLGVRNEEKGIVHGVHHPKFNIDNDALEIGIQMMSLAVFS